MDRSREGLVPGWKGAHGPQRVVAEGRRSGTLRSRPCPWLPSRRPRSGVQVQRETSRRLPGRPELQTFLVGVAKLWGNTMDIFPNLIISVIVSNNPGLDTIVHLVSHATHLYSFLPLRWISLFSRLLLTSFPSKICEIEVNISGFFL